MNEKIVYWLMNFTRPKHYILIASLFFCIIFALSACCSKKAVKSQPTSTLLQVCPEEWIQNQMPGPATSEVKEYFIYQGERRELKEFDLEWIKKNCNIKPQIVQ